MVALLSISNRKYELYKLHVQRRVRRQINKNIHCLYIVIAVHEKNIFDQTLLYAVNWNWNRSTDAVYKIDHNVSVNWSAKLLCASARVHVFASVYTYVWSEVLKCWTIVADNNVDCLLKLWTHIDSGIL